MNYFPRLESVRQKHCFLLLLLLLSSSFFFSFEVYKQNKRFHYKLKNRHLCSSLRHRFHKSTSEFSSYHFEFYLNYSIVQIKHFAVMCIRIQMHKMTTMLLSAWNCMFAIVSIVFINFLWNFGKSQLISKFKCIKMKIFLLNYAKRYEMKKTKNLIASLKN